MANKRNFTGIDIFASSLYYNEIGDHQLKCRLLHDPILRHLAAARDFNFFCKFQLNA